MLDESQILFSIVPNDRLSLVEVQFLKVMSLGIRMVLIMGQLVWETVYLPEGLLYHQLQFMASKIHAAANWLIRWLMKSALCWEEKAKKCCDKKSRGGC